ncbi:molecular chaperone TorD family protein [Halorubellus litoreus]|uniref:Molecular chaperone TorD family protein n=1 Tax=Halorubellus litoreus TaxID=755308 RepID=A0ABD5VJV3_9EURY
MATNHEADAEADALADAVDTETGARGAVYALAARTFTEPDEDLYAALADGSLDDEFAALVDRTGLDVAPPDLTVDDDRDTLAARYNDLFVVGYSEVVDGTDGTVHSEGPPVSLYESAYRSEVSWNDVNLDLARAYEYFGVEVDQDERRHHDHVRLELEFAGYLCRVAAAAPTVDAAVDVEGARRARLDFHDRHLSVLVSGLREALDDEPGTSIYGRLARFLDAFSSADVDDLDDRLDVGAGRTTADEAGGEGA